MKKLLKQKQFVNQILKFVLLAFIVIAISLFIGIFGYMYFFRLGFVDGLYNASMILTGMGPVDKPLNNAGKIFGSFYAIYSGVAFLTSVAVLLSPIVHRFLHKFKLDIEE